MGKLLLGHGARAMRIVAGVALLLTLAIRFAPAALAQPSTDFTVRYEFSPVGSLVAGVNTVYFNATASDDAVRITLENTNPFTVTPAVSGLWTGFTEVGAVSQKTDITFPSSGTYTLTGQLKLEKDGVTVYTAVNHTFEVAPVPTNVTAAIKLLQIESPVAGHVAKFSAVTHSNTGPKLWRAFRMTLTCQSGFGYKDFNVATADQSSTDGRGDFDAMMPPTADRCTWTGSGAADQTLFSFPPFTFDVVPAPQPWQLTLTPEASHGFAGSFINFTAQITQPEIILLNTEYRGALALNGRELREIPFDTEITGAAGPLALDENFLTLAVYSRPFNSNTDWRLVTKKDVAIAGIRPGGRVFVPLLGYNTPFGGAAAVAP